MADLLERSVTQSREQARQALYARTLRRLLPDEARILSALADGSVHPTVDLVVRNAVGTVRHRILGNVSSIGRSAGIALPDAVHLYLTNLRALGLVDIGPEDPALAERYEILMTEDVVRRAQAEAGAGRGRSVRAVRGTLRLSPLGWELWQAATPDDPPLYAARSAGGLVRDEDGGAGEEPAP